MKCKTNEELSKEYYNLWLKNKISVSQALEELAEKKDEQFDKKERKLRMKCKTNEELKAKDVICGDRMCPYIPCNSFPNCNHWREV